jgi:hypothetical protein
VHYLETTRKAGGPSQKAGANDKSCATGAHQACGVGFGTSTLNDGG